MGLLSQGSPLSWEETRRHAEHVRKHGILQFLHIYRALRDRHKDVLKWGDEVSGTPSFLPSFLPSSPPLPLPPCLFLRHRAGAAGGPRGCKMPK